MIFDWPIWMTGAAIVSVSAAYLVLGVIWWT